MDGRGSAAPPRSQASIFLHQFYTIYTNLNPNASCFIPAHLTSFTDESVIADEVADDLCELGDLLTQSMLDTQGDICSDVVLPSEAPSNNTYANSGESPYSILNNLRIKNSSRIILGHLNVNSIRNKFDMVSDIMSGKIDIFLISEDHFIAIQDFIIQNSNQEKLLGITLDNKLAFDVHVSKLCGKASQKLHALVWISHFMSTKQRQIIMKTFIQPQFGYCPLVWMFHSRKLNSRIIRSHERSFRLVYADNKSPYQQLLEKDNSSKTLY